METKSIDAEQGRKNYAMPYRESDYGITGNGGSGFIAPTIAAIIQWVEYIAATIALAGYYIMENSSLYCAHRDLSLIDIVIPILIYLFALLCIRIQYELMVVVFAIHSELKKINAKLK